MNNDQIGESGGRDWKWLKGVGLAILFAMLSLNLFVAADNARKAAEESQRESAYQTTRLWEDVRERVRQNYVEGGDKLTYENLTFNALKGMLDSLDPHSQFMEPRSLKMMREETNQKFGGLGIEITVRDEFPTVVAPIEDSPAFKAGLMPGDKIVKVDGVRTERMKLNEVVDKLKGDPGTQVTIQIFRAREKDPEKQFRDVTLTRAIIKVASIKDARMINEKEKVGYLRITQFGDRTDEELEDGLKKLEKDGMKALVIDLRGNPGGLLDTAQHVCEKFVEKGQLIVKTTGRRPGQSRAFLAETSGTPRRYPLAILVNNSSASASEIVAGCLKDLKRAILVGEKTFGKGSVQSIIDLEYESKDAEGKPQRVPVAVKITTAEYRTPSNKPIHGHGIEPDIFVPITFEEWGKIQEQRQRERMGEKPPAPDDKTVSLPGGGELKERPAEDTQLNRAVDALVGVLIFAESQPKTAPVVAQKQLEAVSQ